ncbi:MAG TPA: hypothetical protein VIT20_02080 [Propionibacteriaceae bacterium]
MARPPRSDSYLILGRLARSAEGVVYRGYDANRSDREILMVATPDGGPGPGWRDRVARLPADLVLASGSEDECCWLVLPGSQTQRAVELIGLTEPPIQNPLARAWGWPHLHARTGRELLVRIGCTIAGAALLAWIFQLARLLLS